MLKIRRVKVANPSPCLRPPRSWHFMPLYKAHSPHASRWLKPKRASGSWSNQLRLSLRAFCLTWLFRSCPAISLPRHRQPLPPPPHAGPSVVPPLSRHPPSIVPPSPDGGRMEGQWRDNGGRMEGLARDDGCASLRTPEAMECWRPQYSATPPLRLGIRSIRKERRNAALGLEVCKPERLDCPSGYCLKLRS
jgi:hypothetical protein